MMSGPDKRSNQLNCDALRSFAMLEAAVSLDFAGLSGHPSIADVSINAWIDGKANRRHVRLDFLICKEKTCFK
jgi:hypothetical protein